MKPRGMTIACDAKDQQINTWQNMDMENPPSIEDLNAHL
jgi:hypothetical protein